MEEQASFLGRGWSFPPTFDHRTGTVVMVADEEDIAQSLQILLSTRPGERVMQPEFGCNLDIMLFEPLSATLIAKVRDIIETAFTYYEPRIELIQIDLNVQNANDGLIMITIEYLIRGYNSRYNLVYPFYKEEGNVQNTNSNLVTF